MDHEPTLRPATRLEPGPGGEKAVPAKAYYGARTARALESSHISGVEVRLYTDFIRALGMVKLAAARANFESRRLSAEVLQGIEGACQELMAGKLHDEFRIDVFQGGGGAATDTNANEVIANRALELMGHAKGEYAYCDPQHDVNCSQSAAEAYPTALHLGMVLGNLELVAEVTRLVAALRAKGEEFAAFAEAGGEPPGDRSTTLGRELQALAQTLAEEVRALVAIQGVLREVDTGGAMVEADVGSPPEFPARWARHLARIAGFPVRLTDGQAETTRDTQVFVIHSSCLKSLAIRLSEVARYLCRLSTPSGGGPCDTEGRPVRGPSSPTSGRENTVIPELVSMVCFRVIGGDLTVALAAEAGRRQGEVFGPVIAACIFEAQTTLLNAARTLRVDGVVGISAPPGMMAADDPVAGYDRAGDLAMEMMKTGRGIVELLRRKKVLREELIAEGHDPEETTARKRPPRRRGGG